MPIGWTKDEEKQLISEISNKKPYDEISKIHNRSISAILLRINKIVYDNVNAGKSEKSLASLFKMDVDKIKQAYYEHKSFIERKSLIQNTNPTSHIKSVKPTISMSSGNKQDIRIMKLRKENVLLNEIIKHIKLKQQMNKYVDSKVLNKEILRIIKNSRKK